MSERKAFVVVRSDSIEIVAPFHGGFVEDIKASIYPRDRQYIPESRSWRVSARVREEVLAIVQLHYDSIEIVKAHDAKVVGKPEDYTHWRWKPEEFARFYPDFALFGILPESSGELRKAAYRVKANSAHPDKIGGSNDVMKQVNLAFERIMKE